MLAIGADLEPGTILAAYRQGLFPMPVQQGGEMGWWSPEPRGVLPVTGLRVSRSLRRSCARYQVTVDSCFERVVNLCADPSRPHGWIDQRIIDSFLELHQLGWAHSVETWRDEELVGGLYGVAIGGLFAGESMFHHATDASKVALVALVELLNDGQPRLIDVQWRTDHLGSLGVIEVARIDYLRALVVALGTSQPAGLRS
ncbi:MAG: leucyl/phenylalanyl-tRNA--protein transferase [Acidimicrobiales bacterium]